jgi:hypothetical protein
MKTAWQETNCQLCAVNCKLSDNVKLTIDNWQFTASRAFYFIARRFAVSLSFVEKLLYPVLFDRKLLSLAACGKAVLK